MWLYTKNNRKARNVPRNLKRSERDAEGSDMKVRYRRLLIGWWLIPLGLVFGALPSLILTMDYYETKADFLLFVRGILGK